MEEIKTRADEDRDVGIETFAVNEPLREAVGEYFALRWSKCSRVRGVSPCHNAVASSPAP